jgi:membrane-associated phospholipid phosphatase
MWAYVAAYKAPHDDAHGQAAKVRIDYPITIDRALGLGQLPTVRLQRALAAGDEWRALDKVLVWTHWLWFLSPHSAVAYILWRQPERFPQAAALTYAVFDLGACIYWVLPTAPPWYAASECGRQRAGGMETRRMMAEYGEFFWRDRWGPLYSVFGGNPLAAMPSLHFATSLMAALLLTEAGPIPGALGFGYLITLGFALVYLGEHYVADLIGGAALTIAVRRAAPALEPAFGAITRTIGTLESWAHRGVEGTG